MAMPGRGGLPPDHDPYGTAPTPPAGLPVAPAGTPVQPGTVAPSYPAPDQYTPDPYTEPVPSATGSRDPNTGPGADPDPATLPPGTTGRPTATRKHSRAGAAWVALVVAAIVMIFLLIFIVQNSDPVQVRYFGVEGTLPLGVAMLFAAIAGALTAGLLGTVRILQLRARARRAAAG